MAELIVYGIRNCDTVKKALTWLDNNKIPYTFHDFKSKGISDAKLREWINQVGWESLVNRKGMTWRQLDEGTKARVTSTTSAIAIMKEKTSVIRRPVIERNSELITLGYDEEEFKRKLK